MPLRLALAVRKTVAGRRLGALEGGYLPPSNAPLPPEPSLPQTHRAVRSGCVMGEAALVDVVEPPLPRGPGGADVPGHFTA